MMFSYAPIFIFLLLIEPACNKKQAIGKNATDTDPTSSRWKVLISVLILLARCGCCVLTGRCTYTTETSKCSSWHTGEPTRTHTHPILAIRPAPPIYIMLDVPIEFCFVLSNGYRATIDKDDKDDSCARVCVCTTLYTEPSDWGMQKNERKRFGFYTHIFTKITTNMTSLLFCLLSIFIFVSPCAHTRTQAHPKNVYIDAYTDRWNILITSRRWLIIMKFSGDHKVTSYIFHKTKSQNTREDQQHTEKCETHIQIGVCLYFFFTLKMIVKEHTLNKMK